MQMRAASRNTIAVPTSNMPPPMSTGSFEVAEPPCRSIRIIGRDTAIASMPIGTNVRNTNRQLRYCRNTANSISPTSVPNRAPIMGTENARPRSCAGNAAASIALAFPIIIAEPSPVSPRHITTCSRLPDMLMRTDPTVDSTSPAKNTRACPYLSPSRAASITKAPSVSR